MGTEVVGAMDTPETSEFLCSTSVNTSSGV